jgi:hypothetical protein
MYTQVFRYGTNCLLNPVSYSRHKLWVHLHCFTNYHNTGIRQKMKLWILCNSVLWIRNNFFRNQIPFSSKFWIRILLDLQKVFDPCSYPTLYIHSFIMPTILKIFSWHLSILFNENVRLMYLYFYCHKYQIFLMIFDKVQVHFRIRILQKVSDPCGSGSGSLKQMSAVAHFMYKKAYFCFSVSIK